MSTVDDVHHPSSTVSDDTGRVIQQKVAICHLCHLTATFLPPFKKYTNNRKPARCKGLQRAFFFLPPLPPVFEGPFIYRIFFIFFYFSTQPSKIGGRGGRNKNVPQKPHNSGLSKDFT